MTLSPVRIRAPRGLLALPLLVALALAAAGCAAAASPSGWAGTQPVRVEAQDLVLTAHKSRLYAMPQGRSAALWRFPAEDNDTYPMSELGREFLSAQLQELDLPDDQHDTVQDRIDDLTVDGSTIDALDDAVDATSAPDDAKSDFKSLVDDAARFERDALGDIEALYGTIGVSEDGETAYVPAFGGAIFALDTLTGFTRWIVDPDEEMVGGVAVSEDGDTIYVGSKGKRLYALDSTNGEPRWTFDTDGEVWATPTLDGDTIYVTSFEGSVYALDESGNQKWAFRDAEAGIASRPTVADGTVYVGAFDSRVYAISADDGSERWSFKGDNWFWAAPLVEDGIVYAASLDNNVYAIDAETGERRWEDPFDAGAPVRSTPTFVDDGLVVATRNGEVFKLDLATGAADIGPIEAGTKIYADLTTDGAYVFVKPTSATLYVMYAAGGLATESFPLPD